MVNKIIVDQNGKINTIKKAIELIDNNSNNEIIINSGIYFEKIKINYPGKNNHYLKIIGNGNVVISFNDHAKKIHQDGLEFNTFRTPTMKLIGENIFIEKLTIINSSGKGKIYGQAVALSLTGNNIYINECRIIANQDTIFLGPLPFDLIERYQNFLESDELIYPKKHYVEVNNTYIEGDIDFVFGGAEAYFNNCEFHSNGEGFIFAPCTEKIEEVGFVIKNCKFTTIDTTKKSFLARPWRDYGYVKIVDSTMDNHILDEGFDKWNNTSRDKTCRFYEFNSSYFDKHKFKRIYFVNNNDLPN